MKWYDRAEKELEDSLTNGEITQKEFNYEIRELNREYAQAESDADEARRNNY